MSTFSSAEKFLAIVPHFAAPFSIYGSSRIIVEILSENRKKLSEPYHRLVFGMSVMDTFSSAAWFLSTWPIPRNESVYGASGTRTTCSAQGFFIQMSIVAALYNASLAVHHYLIVARRWREWEFERIERYIHVFFCGFGLLTSLTMAFTGYFNNNMLTCWIAAYPSGCLIYDDRTCERGKHSWDLRWALYTGPLSVVVFLSTILVFLTFRSVKKQERRTRIYRKGSDIKESLTSQVAWQSFWYLSSFYTAFMFPLLGSTVEAIDVHDEGEISIVFLGLMATLASSQGFFNFLVYMRPKYYRYCRNNPEASWLKGIFEGWLLINFDCSCPLWCNQQAFPGAKRFETGGKAHSEDPGKVSNELADNPPPGLCAELSNADYSHGNENTTNCLAVAAPLEAASDEQSIPSRELMNICGSLAKSQEPKPLAKSLPMVRRGPPTTELLEINASSPAAGPRPMLTQSAPVGLISPREPMSTNIDLISSPPLLSTSPISEIKLPNSPSTSAGKVNFGSAVPETVT